MTLLTRIGKLWRSWAGWKGGLGLAYGLGIVTFGAALLVYAWLGTFSRYYADDYCLTGGFLSGGFWRSQVDLYLSWSPRFSVAFFLNLSELLGRQAIQGWTALVILLWTAALGWTFVQVVRALRLALPAWLAVLLAEALIFFTILEAPQQYQSVYWRVGLITYTLPLAFLSFLIGLIVRQARRSPPGRLPAGGMAACGLLAFVAGGFSETYVAFQTGLLGLALVGAWLAFRGPERGAWRALAAASLAGSLLALLAVVLAPGNAVRLAAMPERPALFELARIAASSAFVFLHASLSEFGFQNAIALLLPLLASYIPYARQAGLPRLRPGPLAAALFLTPLVGGLLILAVCMPSAWAQSSYPEGRVLIEARFVLVAVLLLSGALTGLILGQLHQWAGETAAPLLRLGAVLAFLAASLYPLYDARKTLQQVPAYRARAETWDAHAAVLRAELEQGRRDVNLLDSQARSFDEFSGLMEIGSEAEFWVNQCAADFFGLDSLTVNGP